MGLLFYLFPSVIITSRISSDLLRFNFLPNTQHAKPIDIFIFLEYAC